MLVLLVVLGAAVGMLLGLVALSMFSSVSVGGLGEHVDRPLRERRPNDHVDTSTRAERYPKVPAPLAPMTQTPAVLGASPERVLPAVASVFDVPSVPRPIPSARARAVPLAVATAPDVPAVARREPPPPPSVAPVVAPPPEARPAFVAYEAENARESAAVALDAASAIAADPELVDLLRHGHFVAAIKRYEARHGVGLQQAKAAIDAWKAKSEQREQVAEVVEQVVTDPQIVAAIRKGKLVEAIKLYRAKTGVSLQDAKEAIDTWRRQLGR